MECDSTVPSDYKGTNVLIPVKYEIFNWPDEKGNLWCIIDVFSRELITSFSMREKAVEWCQKSGFGYQSESI